MNHDVLPGRLGAAPRCAAFSVRCATPRPRPPPCGLLQTGVGPGPRTHSSEGGDETLGNPHRAQMSQFELFELILLLKLAKQFPAEQFEATVSQNSTLPHVTALLCFCCSLLQQETRTFTPFFFQKHLVCSVYSHVLVQNY